MLKSFDQGVGARQEMLPLWLSLLCLTMSPSFHGNIQQFPFNICMLELAGEI